MPISPHDLQRVVAVLADEQELKATVRGGVYGGVIAGVTTCIGGLIAGPPGLAIGGAVGGALAFSTSSNFKPVSQIIKDMSAHDRQLLYDYMKDILDRITVDDYVALLAFLSGGPGLLLRQQLIDKTVDFLKTQMQNFPEL
ncbi:predicted protein [Nematostella vectensis]|uniref:Uncharacterized protein n=1 Tax=Nematostella vectensis TaxID=45351 RepID=A7SGY1_NEMVE|nr:predicted protein [Nematostella vectensis]|eukprot:XP_001629153.1 predicted protein [Nematostella vectensis]